MHSAKQAVVLVSVSVLLATVIAACAVKQTADKVEQEVDIVWPSKPAEKKQ